MARSQKLVGAILSLTLLTLPIIAVIQKQAIADWYKLRNYEPPAAVAAIASATTMTEEGKKLFYVNQPALLDKTNFRQYCSDSEQSIVLGCFRSGEGIYLLNVTDSRLNGVVEVTAVHEMLHAAYERLSDNEQQRIDQLTLGQLNVVKDKRVQETISQYESKGSAVVADELHSILATEVSSLPTELEQYYKQYLGDRKKVVAFAQQYASEFTSREKQLEVYKAQLESIKKQSDADEATLRATASSITRERARLDTLLASGDYEAYNAVVNAFNASVRAYNNKLGAYKQLIVQYNDIVQQYNALASEERELVDAIDSRLDTQAIE